MFGSKNNDPAKNQVSLTQSALNSLVSGTSVEGTISADNDIRIDGYLKGQFRGSLFIEDLLHIKETAQVEGEINTDKLSVAPGARFNVLSKMSTSSSGPAPLPKKEQ
jgi:cytoskeletal protein CcmA (bactofilin family)